MSSKQHNQHPDMYNGVVLGAFLVLVALLWFAIPLLFTGRLLAYPGILLLIGIITVVRHSKSQA